MKKIMALVLSVLMVAALCAGCGDKTETTEPAAETATAATEAPAADAAVPTETATAAAAPAAPSGDKASGAPSGAKPSGVPSGDKASGAPSGSGEGETGQKQTLETYSAAGYDKTWKGYIQYCIDAQNADAGAPEDIKTQNITALQAATEDTYDPSASPFSMMIEFGMILSYEDFLKA